MTAPLNLRNRFTAWLRHLRQSIKADRCEIELLEADFERHFGPGFF